MEDKNKAKNKHKNNNLAGDDQIGKDRDEHEHMDKSEDEDKEVLIQLDITSDDKIILNIRKENADYYRATLSIEKGLEEIQAKIHGERDDEKIVEEVISIFEEIYLESELIPKRSKETIIGDRKKMEKILEKVNYSEGILLTK